MSQQPKIGQQTKAVLAGIRGLLGGYPFITLAAGLVVGLLIGWLVLGWWLFPVHYTDARIADLSANAKADTAYQQNFFRLAADSYQFGRPIQDIALWLGDGWAANGKSAKENVLAALDNMLKDKDVHLLTGEDSEIQALRSALANANVQIGPKTSGPLTSSGGSSSVGILLLLAVIAIIAIALLIMILRRLRGRQMEQTEEPLPSQLSGLGPAAVASVAPAPNLARGAPKPVAPTPWAGESLPPLAQYVTQYALGDDRYDMSFSIEEGKGDFLGECGVGISETIGVGNPDKVTALEVWLFDKNDIRTLTKVFMSEHCFNDSSLRAKLAPKGEAVMIKKGEVVTLTTQTLKVNARVIDLQYGTGNLPPNSFFQQAKIELAAWSVGG